MPDLKKPLETAVTVEQARTAHWRLLRRQLEPGTAEHRAAEETLQRVRAEWIKAAGHDVRRKEPCPACAMVWVAPVRATEHLPSCPAHPALARLDAAAAATELRGEARGEAAVLLAAAGELLAARKPHRWSSPYFPGHEVDGALQRLVSTTGEPWTVKEVSTFEGVVTEWARAYHPDSDPCPFCGTAVALGERVAHLLSCGSHPAAELADRLEEALRARLGEPAALALLGAVAKRNGLRDALAALARSSAFYEGEWGYYERGVYYSEYYSEAPWRSAIARAQAAIAAAILDQAPADDEVMLMREEAARWRVALQALTAGCSSFWSGMDDGDRGKSLISEQRVPPWKGARTEAETFLARNGFAFRSAS